MLRLKRGDIPHFLNWHKHYNGYYFIVGAYMLEDITRKDLLQDLSVVDIRM